MNELTDNERAKRAAEFSPGCSEAEPRVPVSIKTKARFSGRQIDRFRIVLGLIPEGGY
jgi:hypothetical protein